MLLKMVFCKLMTIFFFWAAKLWQTLASFALKTISVYPLRPLASRLKASVTNAHFWRTSFLGLLCQWLKTAPNRNQLLLNHNYWEILQTPLSGLHPTNQPSQNCRQNPGIDAGSSFFFSHAFLSLFLPPPHSHLRFLSTQLPIRQTSSAADRHGFLLNCTCLQLSRREQFLWSVEVYVA